MKQTRDIMGMPITVEVVDECKQEDIERVFSNFRGHDEMFSTYKATSEISRINRRELLLQDASWPVQNTFRQAEKTKQETKGFFDIWNGKIFDPSGLVKSMAILSGSGILVTLGYKNFYVEAGGDIQAMGKNSQGKNWQVGIRNPFNKSEIVKVVTISNQGLATSGSYERGAHIYNPHKPNKEISDIVSITVIGKNVYEADRFATAAFAMGKQGVEFIEQQEGLEGYVIDSKGMATMTSGFSIFTELT